MAKQGLSQISLGRAFRIVGHLFYLYLASVSVPLLGTGFVETPKISGARAIVDFILFLLCFYFGFIRRAKGFNRGQRLRR
jgi:hypothetical protein